MEKKIVKEAASNLVYSDMDTVLCYFTKKADSDFILKFIQDSATSGIPNDVRIGYITEIAVLERKTKKGQPFNQIQFEVESDGKRYRKRYSVDFCRKYLTQLKLKAENCHKALVLFKVNEAMYISIGYFAFIKADLSNPDMPYYFPAAYVDEGKDYSEALAKLGL